MEWISLLAALLLPAVSHPAKNDAAARESFRAAYTVLMHPRCMNCHPIGDAPLQGDDSHVHLQNVKRGATGHGKYGMKCQTCHQETNLAGANMPPGVHDWHMPLPTMRLVFEGKSAGELCRQMRDLVRNGGSSLRGVIDHLEPPPGKWGWAGGGGRSQPPMFYAAVMQNLLEWLDVG